MPMLKIPWALQGPTYLPVRVSNANPPYSNKVRTRLVVATGVPESRISPSLIQLLGMLPIGNTEATWFGTRGKLELPFYLVDLHVTVGGMGMAMEQFTMRNISVVPGNEWGNMPGIIIGSDLIRRGQLIIDGAGIGLCL